MGWPLGALGCKQKLRFAVNDRMGIEPGDPPVSR
jgi:hypothetical protein